MRSQRRSSRNRHVVCQVWISQVGFPDWTHISFGQFTRKRHACQQPSFLLLLHRLEKTQLSCCSLCTAETDHRRNAADFPSLLCRSINFCATGHHPRSQPHQCQVEKLSSSDPVWQFNCHACNGAAALRRDEGQGN